MLDDMAVLSFFLDRLNYQDEKRTLTGKNLCFSMFGFDPKLRTFENWSLIKTFK